MEDPDLVNAVRRRIIEALQQDGVREIVQRHLLHEVMTGVPADTDVVANEIFEYVKDRILNEPPETP